MSQTRIPYSKRYQVSLFSLGASGNFSTFHKIVLKLFTKKYKYPAAKEMSGRVIFERRSKHLINFCYYFASTFVLSPSYALSHYANRQIKWHQCRQVMQRMQRDTRPYWGTSACDQLKDIYVPLCILMWSQLPYPEIYQQLYDANIEFRSDSLNFGRIRRTLKLKYCWPFPGILMCHHTRAIFLRKYLLHRFKSLCQPLNQ